LQKFYDKLKFIFGLVQLLILFFISTCVAFAEENEISTIDIVTPVWEGITNRDGTGLYFELLQMVYEPVGIEVTIEFVPWARAVKRVDSKSRDAMLGSYNTVDAFFPRYPLDTEYSAVVYKKGSVEKWNGVNTIENKAVVWVRGYNYHKYLPVKVKYHEVNRSEQGWKMLILGRVDFFMNSLNAINRYVNRNKVDLTDYRIKIVLVKSLFVRFAKTEKSKKLIEIYDSRMKELIEKDSLRKLFEKWNAFYPDFQSIEK